MVVGHDTISYISLTIVPKPDSIFVLFCFVFCFVLCSILKVLGRGLRLEPDFSFYSVSRQTPGFVGADLVALVREASLCAVNR